MKRTVVTASYLEAQAGGKRCRLVPVTEEIIRCITAETEIREDASSIIIESFVAKGGYMPVSFEVEESIDTVCLKTARVQAEITLSTGAISWKHADGSDWAKEKGRELYETEVVHYISGEDEAAVTRVKKL